MALGSKKPSSTRMLELAGTSFFPPKACPMVGRMKDKTFTFVMELWSWSKTHWLRMVQKLGIPRPFFLRQSFVFSI